MNKQREREREGGGGGEEVVLRPNLCIGTLHSVSIMQMVPEFAQIVPNFPSK